MYVMLHSSKKTQTFISYFWYKKAREVVTECRSRKAWLGGEEGDDCKIATISSP